MCIPFVLCASLLLYDAPVADIFLQFPRLNFNRKSFKIYFNNSTREVENGHTATEMSEVSRTLTLNVTTAGI